MDEKQTWWDKKHKKYATEDWIDKPTIFAKWAIKYFPKEGELLELGAGHGQDTRFYAQLGYKITSTDFSDTACVYNKTKTPENLKSNITVQAMDIGNPFPFAANKFDIVSAHLAVHYFNHKTTVKVFNEIERVLKPNGVVALIVNSIEDPEYGTGKLLEKDYFELTPGDVKHFFSTNYMKELTKNFETIVLDNQGTTHKDNAKGVFNLIRFVGRKKANKI